MNRRGFLSGMLALGAAPAIVRASSLMPLWVPRTELLTYQTEFLHILHDKTFTEIIEATMEAHRPALIANMTAGNSLVKRILSAQNYNSLKERSWK